MRKSDANLIKQAKSFVPEPGTDVGMSAMLEIVKMYGNSLANGFAHVYAMGFIKGQRAARRAAK